MSQISHQQVEWTHASPLNDHLPYTFGNGLEFDGFNAQCSGCLRQINKSDLRGELHCLDENRCLLTAKGFCPSCNGISCYNFILTASDKLEAEAVELESKLEDSSIN